ncbi:MAG: hypothetical protein M3O85_09060 [Acidobacteriota bacterium]|nr:hypothetical protein [Acidobacteriota bacterium]
MKVTVIAILIAGVVAIGTASVVYVEGPHSTPGIWSMLVGLPGTMASIWISPNRDNYYLMAMVNWLVYFALIQGIVVLKRRFSSGRLP